MQKRGQITVFMIIGIVSVILVSLILFALGNSQRSDLKVSAELTSMGNVEASVVRAYIENCLKITADNAIFALGYQGGYLAIGGAAHTTYDNKDIPYYIDGANINIPTIDEIEARAEENVTKEISKCIDLDVLKGLGFNVTNTSGAKVSFKINEEDILVSMSYPISVSRGIARSELSQFNVVLPIRLGLLYEKSKEIVDGIIAAQQRYPPQDYDVSEHCSSFGNDINVYLINGEIVQLVDQKTFCYKYTHSTKYQFAIRNGFTGQCELEGECS